MKNFLELVVRTGIFAVPFVVLIVADSLFFPFITGKNFTFRIIVEVIFAAWILLALYDKSYRPKFSWILGTFGALIGVMFFANLFGEYPFKSFWSNFERMEGYVTLVHVFLYFLIAGSSMRVSVPQWVSNSVCIITAMLGVLFIGSLFSDLSGAALWAYPTGLVTIAALVFFSMLVWRTYISQDTWTQFFNVTLTVAVLLSWYAFAQFFGAIEISQGGDWRIDGTLGNSTYMAIYTLFHIFIAAFLFSQTSSRVFQSVYAVMILTFVFILLQTGTRGAALGLVGGTFLTLAYIALFAREQRVLRSVAIASCILVLALGGLFIAFRDSAFVQNDPRLARVADITLAEGQTRFTIWSIAFEGVKERPLLGWGQGNYDYVFNKYYKPALFGQETWFDRVHNIVLDWLIVGGVLGALCYFSIFGAVLYYLIIRPLMRAKEKVFSVAERGILFGLLGGYVFHNLFVFDNIISYIFFAVILAYVHGKVATPIRKVEAPSFKPHSIVHVYTPIVGVLACVIVYAVNVPGIQAAGDIIDAFRTTDVAKRLDRFEKALSRNSFANQEIREQMMQQTDGVFRSSTATQELKQQWILKTEAALRKQIEEKPHDARGLLLFGSFYRTVNNLAGAEAVLAEARAVSPNKQQIIFEQGFVALQAQQFEKAFGFFKEAYDLAPDFLSARILYAMAAFYKGDDTLAFSLIDSDDDRVAFAESDAAIGALYNTKRFDLLKEMLTLRIEHKPEDTSARINLAIVLVEEGNSAKAIQVLQKAIEDIPAFKEQAEAIIADIVSTS